MNAIDLCRIMDPQRGEFCAATKQGQPLPAPPIRREPVQHRVTNPRGVRHPFKTEQDHMPVNKRPRVIAAQKRREG